MSKVVLERVQAKFGAQVLETQSFRGDDTIVVARESWHDVAAFLRDDAVTDMAMFIDITAVDWPERAAEEAEEEGVPGAGKRFDLVLHLYSLGKGHRVRLKTRLADGEQPATVSDLWAAANWFEREVWDMFGIKFAGHPDMRRLLMYEEFEGHALRKDYAADRAQPLVPYRNTPDVLDKQAPFRADEGMPFGRRDWQPRDHAWTALDTETADRPLGEAVIVNPDNRRPS
ncbi:MAG: NADH-quinone oxidoreductase subunit C [Myxococcales bacterium]|nr:NADH-quinone oxidoreductase subunit C [Myxococcales bacterium]